MQARQLGASDGMMHRRIATGSWERVHKSVYRLAGSSETWRQALIAACLAWGPGAVASHRAAAALWAFPGFPAGPIELIVPRGRDRKRPGTVHRPLSLPPGDVTTRDAIPVTTPTRTLLDVAAAADARTVEEALDDALRRGLVSLKRMRWQLGQAPRNGRAGAALLRSLVETRADGLPVPQSVLETRVLRALQSVGLPDPIRQHRIRDGGRLVAVVDFAYPERRIAIEAEGFRWHGGRLRWTRDLARRNELTSLGWLVIHVTWSDIVEGPDAALRAIARAMRSSGRARNIAGPD